MTGRSFLIVNADDFGQSLAVNHGIIQGHDGGIVTSASLMVHRSATAQAIELSRGYPNLSLGLHIDLGEWRLRNGEWVAAYEIVALKDRQAVRDEIERQIASFYQFVGRNPTHIDSHQHVHLQEPVRSVVTGLAKDLGVPIRRCEPKIAYCGDFYGHDSCGSNLPDQITVQALIGILDRLAPGFTELCCHPAAGEDPDTVYSAPRVRELEVLRHSKVYEAIAGRGITLCSFYDFPRPIM